MTDRRQTIVTAGLGVLREHGYPGFTQPRVAAAAGRRDRYPADLGTDRRWPAPAAVSEMDSDDQGGAVGSS